MVSADGPSEDTLQQVRDSARTFKDTETEHVALFGKLDNLDKRDTMKPIAYFKSVTAECAKKMSLEEARLCIHRLGYALVRRRIEEPFAMWGA
jgi:hypothetical protein